MVSASLDMLEESLVKKIKVMKEIEAENDNQKAILKSDGDLDLESYDKTLDKKGELIDQLNFLDEGFQSMFDQVKKDIGQNKELYRDQIKRMQAYIQEITSLSASIEAAEHRNKKLAEERISNERRKLNMSKQTSAAAFNYYRTMNNFKDIPPQYLDTKTQ